MKTVGQLLQSKSQEIWFVSPNETVFSALQLMAGKNIGALLVIDAGRLVGIFSERDYARKVILKGKSSKDIPVREIMSTTVVTVEPGNTVEKCMTLMTDKRIRHLPVLDSGKLSGVISIGDVVKAIISDQEFMIEQLEQYISGNR